MNRIHLQNATLVDGSEAAPSPGGLLVEGDRIAAAGRFDPPSDAQTLDCTGLTICPGFVDAHSHSDLQAIKGRREKLLSHPLSLVVSDGFYVKGRPHPRLYGTFPRLLGRIRRDRGWLSLAQAVRKITDLPARRFGIRRRGRLQPGWFADLVVFDADAIDSPATYETPDVPPVGIRYVLRDGKIVVDSP